MTIALALILSFIAGALAHKWIVREDLKLAALTKALVAGRIAAQKAAIAAKDKK